MHEFAAVPYSPVCLFSGEYSFLRQGWDTRKIAGWSAGAELTVWTKSHRHESGDRPVALGLPSAGDTKSVETRQLSPQQHQR